MIGTAVNWVCDFFDKPSEQSPIIEWFVTYICKGLICLCGLMLIATFGCLGCAIIEAGIVTGTWIAIWNFIVPLAPWIGYTLGSIIGSLIGTGIVLYVSDKMGWI